MLLSKKVCFLWLFIAIKLEFGLFITFMAFYDCVRTLVNVGKSLSANIVSTVDPLSYVDMCIECITDPLITVDDVMSYFTIE